MRKYRVLVTPDAKADLKKYLGYLQSRKKNPQAVKNVLEDFRATKKSLSVVAGSIADPGSKKLKEKGLKRLNFVNRHQYFLLFKIENDDSIEEYESDNQEASRYKDFHFDLAPWHRDD